MHQRQNSYFYLLIVLFISFSCSDTTELNESLVDNFDRQEILENVTDNIILPAFKDFTQKIEQLEESVILFSDTKNLVNLEEVILEIYKDTHTQNISTFIYNQAIYKLINQNHIIFLLFIPKS
jgi:hypothetical protein